MKTCRFTGKAPNWRSGCFSSCFPPRTPGRALTMYFERSMLCPPVGERRTLRPKSRFICFYAVSIAFSRLAHNFFHAFDDIRRLMNNFFCQLFQPFASYLSDLPLPLLPLSDK